MTGCGIFLGIVNIAVLIPNCNGTGQNDTQIFSDCQADITNIASTHNDTGSVGCYVSPETKDLANTLRVTLYYVRHGESQWNEMSKTYFEWQLNRNPKLTDAKLTEKGVGEARVLSDTIVKMAEKTNTPADWKLLAGQKDLPYEGSQGPNGNRTVAFATSNLRRASLTFLSAFKHLMSPQRKVDKLHILSALQEPASNIDSNSLSRPHGPPALSPGCPLFPREEDIFNNQCNHGDEMDKKNRHHSAEQLLDNFCIWMRNMAVFGQVPTANENVVGNLSRPVITDFVVAGHSMFLRGFFKRFMKPSKKSSSLENRIASTFSTVGNGSLIKITLDLHNPRNKDGKLNSIQDVCQIVPANTELLNGNLHGRGILKKISSSIHVNALETHQN